MPLANAVNETTLLNRARGLCAMYPDQVLLEQELFHSDDGGVGKMSGLCTNIIVTVRVPEVCRHSCNDTGAKHV